jgi:hypothetical protein
MAHSVIALKERVYMARDEVIEMLAKRTNQYAEQMSIEWLLQACQEWLEHCDVMPPGAKRIELVRPDDLITIGEIPRSAARRWPR